MEIPDSSGLGCFMEILERQVTSLKLEHDVVL